MTTNATIARPHITTLDPDTPVNTVTPQGGEPDYGASPPLDAGGNQIPIPGVLARARGGDSAAFTQIYIENVDQIRRVIRRRLQAGAHRDVEDLVQQVFVRAWGRIGVFQWQGKSIAAWLTVIACNLVRDYHKCHARREVVCDEPVGADQASTQPGPVEWCLRGEDRARLDAALTKLTPAQAEAVRLHYFQDYSIRQTAAVLGMSESAVKVLLYRAVRSLYRVMTGTARPTSMDGRRR